MTIRGRIAAVVAALALCAGNVAVCAGWQPTPEARMACCMSGMNCPMHESDHHDRSSRSGVSQAQADHCCAASTQRRDSAAAGSTFVASGTAAFVAATVFPSPVPVFESRAWRAPVPLPDTSVAKHLLNSVLLV